MQYIYRSANPRPGCNEWLWLPHATMKSLDHIPSPLAKILMLHGNRPFATAAKWLWPSNVLIERYVKGTGNQENHSNVKPDFCNSRWKRCSRIKPASRDYIGHKIWSSTTRRDCCRLILIAPGMEITPHGHGATGTISINVSKELKTQFAISSDISTNTGRLSE